MQPRPIRLQCTPMLELVHPGRGSIDEHAAPAGQDAVMEVKRLAAPLRGRISATPPPYGVALRCNTRNRTQVSRFDRWKDPFGVLETYRLFWHRRDPRAAARRLPVATRSAAAACAWRTDRSV